jgi:hypothetical protein
MYLDFLKNENVILADVDGVLLNWNRPFQTYMAGRGHTPHSFENFEVWENYEVSEREGKALTRSFNESVHIRHLPPHADAVKYVRKLHEEHGYVLHCITALDPHQYVYDARWNNLKDLFGTAIERLVLTGSKSRGGDKGKVLDEYAPGACFWIEDQVWNAELGLERNMDCLLMNQPYNMKTELIGTTRVFDWKDIYYEITGQ